MRIEIEFKLFLKRKTYDWYLKFARDLEYQKMNLTTAKQTKLKAMLLRNINPILLKSFNPENSTIEKASSSSSFLTFST
jgi:hypothetical protein